MREALIEARRKAVLSQKDVAEAVGISRSFYTLIERGSRNPSLPVALRIARFFGRDTRDLFNPGGRPAPADRRSNAPAEKKERAGGGQPCRKP